MAKLIDLTGQTFFRWVVLKQSDEKKCGRTSWVCRCSCGAIEVVIGNNLVRKITKSCGCLQREGKHDFKAGPSSLHPKEHATWGNMMQRCYNPKNTHYADYGGRGIAVVEEWHKFANFFADMGKKPNGLTLERVNNSLGYSKENCKWATTKEQARNTRKTVRLTVNGVTKTQSEWAQSLGLTQSNLAHRLASGWSIEMACTEPARFRKTKKQTLQQSTSWSIKTHH